MAYYKDLREYVKALEANNKLVRITKEINKDTELQPIVRWQFRGLPESERKAFLFENVTDAKGKKYDIPVLIATLAPSKAVYALGMMCGTPDKIMGKWEQALLHPVEPKVVRNGPVHEVVHLGDTLLEHGGLDEFPVPIATPGFDNAPYLTGSCWVSKDAETGVTNVGTYRAMIKSQTRTGICSNYPQHLGINWLKAQERGKPLQAAVVLGASPNVGYASVSKIPYELSEYAVAGGIAGEPLELVRCKTVDLEVPATAEIVIEGEFPTDSLEREAPFAEHTGYMGKKQVAPFFNVTCITHRKNPIFNAFISAFPPSESSVLRAIGAEAVHYNFLKHTLAIPNIVRVAFHQESGSHQFCVISLKKIDDTQVWRALHGVAALTSNYAKIVIVVDDDIDPGDPDSVIWALVYRMQPDTDIEVLLRHRHAGLDPSALSPDVKGREHILRSQTATLLVDATRKWAYPPTAQPKKQFMERAKEIWEELGLPALQPKVPWFGISLGDWTEEDEEEAELALKGEHYQTGEKLAKQRVKAKRK